MGCYAVVRDMEVLERCSASIFMELLGPEHKGNALLQKSVIIYQSTRSNILEDLHLHQHCCETLESHITAILAKQR